MKDTIKKIMNQHEVDFPEDGEARDISIEDLLSLGKPSPAKPLAMHVAYSMDGHHNNKSKYRRNYDHRLTDKDKDDISHEVAGLSEIVSMLSHPGMILDESDDPNITENRKMAREVMQHLKGKHQGKEFERALEKELLTPLLNMFLDHNSQKGTAVEEVLSPTVTRETDHKSKDYHKAFRSILFSPIAGTHSTGHYSKILRDIYEKRQ